jgi:hypothetical protein
MAGGVATATAIRPRTGSAWAWSLGLIVSFSMALIGAGHGVAPLGLLLVWGIGHWFEPVVLGWLAIIVLLTGALVSRWSSLPVLPIGAALLFADWCYFMSLTEGLPLVLVLSAPFLACTGAYVVWSWRTMILRPERPGPDRPRAS